jgi:phosphatidylserine decarboxylase
VTILLYRTDLLIIDAQYIVLTLGDSKVVTHSVPKTLNPDWNVVEELPVNSVQCLLLDVICWDKDRFGKDYLGEFDLALEEIFANGENQLEPKWYPLKSKKPGKKTSVVSGEVMLQFTLFDSTSPSATDQQIFEKFNALVGSVPLGSSRNVTPTMTPIIPPLKAPKSTASPSPPLSRNTTEEDEDEEEDLDMGDETPEDEQDMSKPEAIEKRKRRLRIKGLKKKRRQNPYEFTNGGSDVVGIIYLELCKITDLPPQSNLTRTSFDMDPFVVATLGKKTYRTRRVRHNLNPVFNEKMIFQVLAHEQAYSFGFTVIDHDKYSGNDFIASCNLSVKDLIEKAPKANPETGLYDLKEPPEYVPPQRPRFMKLGMSRSSSTQSLSKLSRPVLTKNPSTASTSTMSQLAPPEAGQTQPLNPGLLTPGEAIATAGADATEAQEKDDPEFQDFSVPLKMKNTEKWEAKHNPVLYLRAKYVPYKALRQQFWRSMLKQYDTDESGLISKVELTTMLDTLGSTLRESTIDSFFQRFPHKASNGDDCWDLTVDEAVICLEDQLESRSKGPTLADRMKGMLPDASAVRNMLNIPGKPAEPAPPPTLSASSSTLSPQSSQVSTDLSSQTSHVSTIVVPELATPGEEGEFLDKDDLNEDRSEEHVVEIRECPICHQPRLNKRKDADIITHIATCASQDWRQVNTLVMGGFVTASQAQRKWYSKVITKISYGGYKLGANSANILVQDRLTGQINEEKMSVYVRLGIRLLYKGLKSREMENKRSKSS